jgi:hypothetical protein
MFLSESALKFNKISVEQGKKGVTGKGQPVEIILISGFAKSCCAVL